MSGTLPRTVEIATERVPLSGGKTRLARFCARALQEAGFSRWAVSVLLCDDARITELNARYRGLKKPTDVLSFPDTEGRAAEPVAGDIAISLEALRRNAAEYGESENEEMKRLLVHGLLHLAGMDHGRGRGGKMLVLQERLLNALKAEKVFGGTRE
jgi:probable rRNA maturation factor